MLILNELMIICNFTKGQQTFEDFKSKNKKDGFI